MKNIFIWGTGRLVGKVVGKYIALEKIAAFIDNDDAKKEYMGKKVYSPKVLANMEYDAILVINSYSKDIFEQCNVLGINLMKVLFLYNNIYSHDLNQNYQLLSDLLGSAYADLVKSRYHIVRGVEAYGDLFLQDNQNSLKGYAETDYVRVKCFELAVKEIRKKKVVGETAEVGVFRGEFAQYINYAFPDKKLYLFDTFEGFDASEALNELKSGNCTDSFVEAYKQTNLSHVYQRMTNVENIIIKQGFFPDSLEGLEEQFAFVSLDVDFEQSIYEGLCYFYPRLMAGGYIFVHDYNSDLRGVELAVDRFEQEIGSSLCKIPLCDANGTLVITK